MAGVFVDQFICSYAKPPTMIVLDMDHFEDATHGQQEQTFFNHHYGSHCYLPLFILEGLSGKLITPALRPGKRPTSIRERRDCPARVEKAARTGRKPTLYVAAMTTSPTRSSWAGA